MHTFLWPHINWESILKLPYSICVRESVFFSSTNSLSFVLGLGSISSLYNNDVFFFFTNDMGWCNTIYINIDLQ